MMLARLCGDMDQSFDLESSAAAPYSRRSIMGDKGAPVAKGGPKCAPRGAVGEEERSASRRRSLRVVVTSH